MPHLAPLGLPRRLRLSSFDQTFCDRRYQSSMSDCSDQGGIDSRDDEDLVFAKVGKAKLSYREDQTRGNSVALAAAAEHGILCLRDDEGIGGMRLIAGTHTRNVATAPP